MFSGRIADGARKVTTCQMAYVSDYPMPSAIPGSSRQFTVLGCGTKSHFGRMSRRQQSYWRLKLTGKQKDRIYRSEPIPVNPVIRNSNHEQSHTIYGVRNSA
jgi:hypothetical protein